MWSPSHRVGVIAGEFCDTYLDELQGLRVQHEHGCNDRAQNVVCTALGALSTPQFMLVVSLRGTGKAVLVMAAGRALHANNGLNWGERMGGDSRGTRSVVSHAKVISPANPLELTLCLLDDSIALARLPPLRGFCVMS